MTIDKVYAPRPINLSEHFTLAEGTVSEVGARHGLVNTPTIGQLASMKLVAAYMEEVRSLCGGNPVSVSSWLRSPEINKLVGSSSNSQHLKGEAVDFNIFHFGTPRQICSLLIQHQDLVPFDQLILENGWVHISFVTNPIDHRRAQVFTITPDRKTHVGLVYYN